MQHEENQADIQDGFHFPPVRLISALNPRPRVVVMSLLSILDGNYAQWKEEKQYGFKLNAPDFINKTTLRSKGAH